MTMLLMSIVFVPVLPVKGKKGWFEISGRPKRTDYPSVEDWLSDAVDAYDEVRIDDAKVVGLHDQEDILQDDPRFNWEEDPEDQPSFAVVKAKDGTHWMGLVINRPEAMLFEYIFDQEDPEGADRFPTYKAGAFEAAQAEFAKMKLDLKSRQKANAKPKAEAKAKARAKAKA